MILHGFVSLHSTSSCWSLGCVYENEMAVEEFRPEALDRRKKVLVRCPDAHSIKISCETINTFLC